MSDACNLSKGEKVSQILTKAGEWEAISDTATDPAVIEKWWLSREDLEVMQAS